MGKLDGKVAIVTGAGRGVGRGIALALAGEGAKVVVTGRSNNVDAVAYEIRQRGGVALPSICEVGVEAQVKATVAQTVKVFDTVHILVNAAQSFGGPQGALSANLPETPLEELPDEYWDITFQTGLKGTFYFMKAVFPSMKEHGGKIINFGSSRGLVAKKGSADYNACKEAIRALSKTAAREWGKYRINVNIIMPWIETDAYLATKAHNPEFAKRAEKRIPIGFIGKPEEHAGPLAVFLASSDSDYITGHTFLLDGGLNMASF